MDWIKRNFGLRLIALAAAVVLWFTFNYESGSQAYTKTLDVPLALHGVGSGLVAATLTQNVTVELTGTRAALDALVPDDFIAYVDCGGKRAGTVDLNVSVVGPQTDKPLSVSPATAIVVLERYEYRRVPVIPDASESTATVVRVDPMTVVVAGGQTAVSRVFAAEVSVATAGVTKPVTVTLKAAPVDMRLNAVGDVAVAPANVKVTLAPRKADE
jgi:YbbR domain-containing protein